MRQFLQLSTCCFVIMTLFLSVNLSSAQSFVGSETCKSCHGAADVTKTGYSIYGEWELSGHPYKFSIVENDEPPMYPSVAVNFQDTWMDSLGDGSHTWADIAGVIGGYGWKSRFVGTDGHIIGTGGSSFSDAGQGHNQFNFYGGEAHGWVNYETSNMNKVYNYGCFKCHTTGGDTTGTWLEGVEGLGTFTEGGIGCESCHGPGSDHISAPSKTNIDLVYEFAHLDNSLGGLEVDGAVIMPNTEGNDVNFLCGTCHNRSYTDPINSSGGFIKHHEQWDEFVTTKHKAVGYDCVTCHDPHKRVIWDGDGITKTCEGCHTDQAAQINHADGVECIDCHMPFAAKSGTARGQSGYKADVRSHIFTITADTASMFNATGSAVRDDEGRRASLSPAYSCLGCHNDDPNDGIPDQTIAQAAEYAKNMHMETAIAHEDGAVLSEYALLQNYPNPFNPGTYIEFQLPQRDYVKLTVYNLAGQTVANLADREMNPGSQKFYFNADNLPSGVYLYQLTTNNFTQTRKMILVK